MNTVIPRVVDNVGTSEWLGEPGLYVLHMTAPEARRTRHRLARIAARYGTTVHTSFDSGRFLVEIRKAAQA